MQDFPDVSADRQAMPLFEAPSGEPNRYDDEQTEALVHLTSRGRKLASLTIAAAAERDGATVTWLSNRDAWAEWEGRRVPITLNVCTESVLSSAIVSDKQLTKDLLDAAGILTPRGRPVTSHDDAVQAQRELGCPVVIKPRKGNMGRGITVNITVSEDIRAAYARAQEWDGHVLVEEYVEGLEYRCHATSEECVGVFQRLLPNVCGDGKSTIHELIREKNKIRKTNPATRNGPIPIDDVTVGFLKRRGLSLESVVPDGYAIPVRDVNGITSGGDSKEYLDAASESLKSAAHGAVAAVPGMTWAGVDILVDARSGRPYVMEINTDASINGSMFPTFGAPRDLASIIWDRTSRATSLDIRTPPQLTRPKGSTSRLSDVHFLEWPESGHLPLSALIAQSMQSRGYQLDYHNARIFTSKKDGTTLWFAGSATELDPFNAARPMRLFALQCRLFARAGVPMPPWSRVRRWDDLERFATDHPGEVRVFPAGRSGLRATPRVFADSKALAGDFLDGAASWIAQSGSPGYRLRVIATPERVLATIVAPDAVQISERERVEAERVSVLAVRAVPGLRWGEVEIVLPSESDSVGPDTAFVERMHRAPVFDRDEVVLGGSISDVLDTVIASEERSELQHRVTR